MTVLTLPPTAFPPAADRGVPPAPTRAGSAEPHDDDAHPWRRRRLPRLALALACLALLRIENGPVGGLIFGFLLITPLELLFRRHPQRVRRPGLRTDMFHLLFTGALSSVATIVAIVAWFLVLLPVTHGQRNPLFVMQPMPLQIIETILALELLGYLAHRALHEVPAFWRFHAIHHSSSTLDWISGARAHPIEGFIAGLLVGPPALLLGLDAKAIGGYTVVVGIWGVFLHANVRWRFRWMDGWWGTPDYHHWHHSNHPEARNKNYSAFLPVLDRLFGTYYQPKDRRPYLYGIDEPVPDSWTGQLRWPLRRDRAVPAATLVPPRSHPSAPPGGPAGSTAVPWPMTSPPVPPAEPWPLAPPAAPAVAGDRHLLGRVAAGDRVALEELYRVHAGWLTIRLLGRCADPELVDIALQDTFVVVWRRAGSFRGDGDVGAWLWGIAIRKLIDQVRRRRPTPVDPASIGAGAGAATAVSAEAELFARGIGGELGHALAHLDPDLRAVLLATAVDGLTTKEAAQLLGIPQGTVKTRLQRARAQLQERLA